MDYDIEPGGGISVDLKGRIAFLVCDSDLLLFWYRVIAFICIVSNVEGFISIKYLSTRNKHNKIIVTIELC